MKKKKSVNNSDFMWSPPSYCCIDPELRKSLESRIIDPLFCSKEKIFGVYSLSSRTWKMFSYWIVTIIKVQNMKNRINNASRSQSKIEKSTCFFLFVLLNFPSWVHEMTRHRDPLLSWRWVSNLMTGLWFFLYTMSHAYDVNFIFSQNV